MTIAGGITIAALFAGLAGLGFAAIHLAGEALVDELSVALGVPRRGGVVGRAIVAAWAADDDAAGADHEGLLHGVTVDRETIGAATGNVPALTGEADG